MEGIFLAEGCSDFLADRPDVAEVEFPVAHAGSAYAEEGDLSFQNGFLRIACGVQAAGFLGVRNQVRHAGFYNRTPPTVEGFDLGCAQVDSSNPVPLVRQASCCNRPHVTQTKNADCPAHAQSLSLLLVPNREVLR
jgi:hypothetical protein